MTEEGNPLRDKILGAEDTQYEMVDVPEWDTTIAVRGMTGEERDAMELDLVGGKPVTNRKQIKRPKNVRALLVVRTACDPETKERIFHDKDADALGQKSGKAIDRLFSVAQELSGMSDDDVEKLEKN